MEIKESNTFSVTQNIMYTVLCIEHVCIKYFVAAMVCNLINNSCNLDKECVLVSITRYVGIWSLSLTVTVY